MARLTCTAHEMITNIRKVGSILKSFAQCSPSLNFGAIFKQKILKRTGHELILIKLFGEGEKKNTLLSNFMINNFFLFAGEKIQC